MSKAKKWFIITIIVVLIIALFRMKAITPASILSAILFLTALAEKYFRIQAVRGARKQGVSNIDLSLEEAKEMFELGNNPTKEEINKAYHRLIQKNHPDQGGSKYLAAKINRARDILLKEVAKK